MGAAAKIWAWKLIRLLPHGNVGDMGICDCSLRRRIEEAFRPELFRLVDDYLRSPENRAHGEILGVSRSYLLITEALQDCAKPTCERRIKGVVVLNVTSGCIAPAEGIAREVTGPGTPRRIASQEGRRERKSTVGASWKHIESVTAIESRKTRHVRGEAGNYFGRVSEVRIHFPPPRSLNCREILLILSTKYAEGQELTTDVLGALDKLRIDPPRIGASKAQIARRDSLRAPPSTARRE